MLKVVLPRYNIHGMPQSCGISMPQSHMHGHQLVEGVILVNRKLYSSYHADFKVHSAFFLFTKLFFISSIFKKLYHV